MRDFLGVGTGPAPLGSSGGSTVSCFPVETFETSILDLTVPNLGVELVPARPGYFPMAQVAQWLITSVAGTQTTPATVQAGSDASHVNFSASAASPSNANVNAAAPPSNASGLAMAATTVRRIPNATVYLDVTAGAQGTGGFTLRAKYQVAIVWVPVG